MNKSATITYTTQENLLRLMNLPISYFAGVCYAGGSYIAQVRGDLGYNHWLGVPAKLHDGPGHTQTLEVWASLSAEEKRAVLALAAHPIDGEPIPLVEQFIGRAHAGLDNS